MKALRKAVVTALTGAALVGFAQQASAINVTNLGALGAAGISRTTTVAKYAWDGTAGLGKPPHNDGWAHTSKWYQFTINQRAHVQISLTATATGMNPAFSVWRTAGAFNGQNHRSHIYNQIGITGASKFLTNGVGKDRVIGFKGYANSGPAFKGGGGNIRHGGTCGAYVKDHYSRTMLLDLQPGQYLIALGGSCYTDGTKRVCGEGAPAVKLKITRTKPTD